MSFFILTSYFTAIASIVFGAFVYFKNRNGGVNRVFLFLALMVALWGVGIANEVTSPNSKIALAWLRVFHVGVCLIPIAFLHFSLSVLDVVTQCRRLIISGYLISVAFILIIPFEVFIKGVRPVIQFPFYLEPGPIYHLFMLYFVAYPAIAEWKLFKGAKRLKRNKSKQAIYVFIAGLIGFLGGLTSYLPAYNVKVYPWMNGFVFLYVFILAISVLRHNLMDIEVIIRKTLVFAGLLAFVFGVFSFGLFISQEVLATYFGFKWEVALAISIFLVVLGYEPMRAWLINITDRYLFQKKYDYQKVLKDAATGIAQIESLHRLLRLVTHFLTMRIRVKNAAVLTRDLGNGDFRVGYQRGYPGEWRQAERISADSPLIRYLDQEREGIEIERVKESIETGGRRPRKNEAFFRLHDFGEIKREMEELHAACAIPSFLGHELRNVLILGEKKSGDYYSQEDLNVLFTLAQQSAIAIENARLYDEAVNKSEELQKINQELENAKARLVHALQETEKANEELRNTQAQLIHEQKMATLGRLAASVGHEVNNPLTILSMNVSRALLKYRKDPNMKVIEIIELFQKMEQNIGRIKAVVNTLTGLLKKSEKGKFEPLSLKLLLEETLPLVQFQTYLENPGGVEVEINIPSSVPLVKGDLERLQEVFLNLFINAYHAMSGRRKPKIVVEAYPLDNGPKMVEVNFSDNGSGMAEEVQKKIFTYGFTTKGQGRGSGMGLYICKYIIELHGGEIKVKSEPGRGTTFLLTLPIYEEPSQVTASPGGYTAG